MRLSVAVRAAMAAGAVLVVAGACRGRAREGARSVVEPSAGEPRPAEPPNGAGGEAAPPEPTAQADGPLAAAEAEALRTQFAELPPRWEVTFQTKLVSQGPASRPAEVPPRNAPFTLTRYLAAAGPLVAYVTKDPRDGRRHPAIVWITGGDSSDLGDMWTEAEPDNDQTAAAYRKAGLVMFVPSLRGGNDNPGRREGFLGEVDDVLAARAYLATLPYVDPDRIYLGGHSTGGTLALLVAETTDRFRAVFSFGPVEHVGGYGGNYVYCDPADDQEMAMRSPMLWLKDVRSPTFVFEGSERGNADSVSTLRQLSQNPRLQFFVVKGATHFDILAPTNALIAAKLLADVGPTVNLSFDPAELARPFAK